MKCFLGISNFLEEVSSLSHSIVLLPSPHLHPNPSYSEKWSCSVMCDSLQSHWLHPTRLLCLWHFPGKSTGVGCHFFLRGIFPTQGSNPGLPHCRQTFCSLSHQGSPYSITRFNPNPNPITQFKNHPSMKASPFSWSDSFLFWSQFFPTTQVCISLYTPTQ